MKPLISLFYYQLKILFIDDDKDLLDTFLLLFPAAQITTSPLDAIEIINKHRYIENFIHDLSFNSEIDINDENSLSIVKFTLNNLIAISSSIEKYHVPTIIVVDYSMPEMNGLEFCNKINNSLAMKILLTGKYDISNAIKALNSNLIDCYIRKGQPDTNDELQYYIKYLNLIYFEKITEHILPAKTNLSFLYDQNYADLFNSTINRLNISEYYLISRTGTYLMINQECKYILITFNNQDLNEFYNMYNEIPELRSINYCSQNKNLIPFFGIDVKPETIETAEWGKYFYNSTYENGYHWSLIEYNER